MRPVSSALLECRMMSPNLTAQHFVQGRAARFFLTVLRTSEDEQGVCNSARENALPASYLNSNSLCSSKMAWSRTSKLRCRGNPLGCAFAGGQRYLLCVSTVSARNGSCDRSSAVHSCAGHRRTPINEHDDVKVQQPDQPIRVEGL